MTGRRFWRYSDLAYQRTCARGSERTVLEALALYETDPRPRTRLDATRVDGLEDSLRVHFGHSAELQRSHHQVRVRPRGRSRRCLYAEGMTDA